METFTKARVVLCLLLIEIIPAFSQCPGDAKSCLAGVPRIMKYTGVLKDAGGNSRAGTLGVTFTIYGEPNGGTPLWQETQNVQVGDGGRYSVLLGSASLEGLSPALFSSGDPRWLGVRVEAPGELEQARIRLVSVPYALAAGNAQTLGGLPPSAFERRRPASPRERMAGTGGSANSAAQPVIGVSSGMPGTSPGNTVVTSGGTPDTIPKFLTPTTIANSQIVDSGGSVSMQNLSNMLFAERFPHGVPDAVATCPADGCVIYATSPNVNLQLGTVDPGSKAVTLYLGPYTYLVDQIMLRRNLKIIGMGSGVTFLQSVNGNNPVVVSPQQTDGAATNVLLQGFRLIGSVGNTSEDAMFWDSSGYTGSGVWYSEVDDIFITGFSGNGIHLKGTNAGYNGLSQFTEFNRVVVFRPPGGGNALRIEGGSYGLYFNDCEFDGSAAGDGTNIFIGPTGGNPYAIPIDVNFRGLTSQTAATAVHIDGGWGLSFYSPHHEYVWGVYLLTGGASIAGVTISDGGFQASGVNNGAGYLLSNSNSGASGVRFIHNNIMGPADAVVRTSNGASVVYRDNLFPRGLGLPTSVGITTQLDPSPMIDIGGAHTVGLTSSTTPITNIQSGLGAGEMATLFSINGPVTLGSGGNINLMGANSLIVNGTITLVVSDLGTAPSWIPISQWSAPGASPTGFSLSTTTPSIDLTPGVSSTFAVTLTPQGGFAGSVHLGCSGLPIGVNCTISPNPLSLTGQNSQTATVLLYFEPIPTASTKSGPNAEMGAVLACMLAGITFVPIGGRKTKEHKTANVALMTLVILSVSGLGCGAPAQGQTSPGAGPPVTSQLTVTATAGSVTQSLLVFVTVR